MNTITPLASTLTALGWTLDGDVLTSACGSVDFNLTTCECTTWFCFSPERWVIEGDNEAITVELLTMTGDN